MKKLVMGLALLCLLTGCSSTPTIRDEKCQVRLDAEQYVETVRHTMTEQGLGDSVELRSFEIAFWESFEMSHEECEICNR